MRPSFLKQKSTPKSQRKPDSRTPSRPARNRHRPASTPPPRRIYSDTSAPRPGDSSDSETNSNTSFIYHLTKITSIILIFIFAIGTLLYIKRDEWGINFFIQDITQENKPKPNPTKYATLASQLKADNTTLRHRFLNASTTAEQQDIISEASALLEERLPPMMRCWLGHPYDFNGTATIPGQGKIACGYFVSVIMRDAGFKINRIRVAQQPSQNIIRTFVNHKKNYEVKTNIPYPKYIDYIKERYEGIHIVGLDTHVAFIVLKGGEMRYIHSSGGRSQCVVDQGVNEASSLRNSNYRVISNISRNQDVIRKWILGEPFHTGGTAAARR